MATKQAIAYHEAGHMVVYNAATGLVGQICIDVDLNGNWEFPHVIPLDNEGGLSGDKLVKAKIDVALGGREAVNIAIQKQKLPPATDPREGYTAPIMADEQNVNAGLAHFSKSVYQERLKYVQSLLTVPSNWEKLEKLVALIFTKENNATVNPDGSKKIEIYGGDISSETGLVLDLSKLQDAGKG